MSLKNCKVILVPVDFSPDSVEAAKQSLILAKGVGCDLVLLHVVHDPSEAPGFYHKKKAGELVVRKMTEAAEEMMSEFIQQNGLKEKAEAAGVSLSVRLVRGLPTSQILHTAKKQKASLIVMGSSGRTGLAHLLLGSTAERIVHLASIPVMVVKSKK